jgi:meiotically up-regulated gene 157 (Mug157) protein
MAIELRKTAGILRKAGKAVLAQSLERRSQAIVDGIWEHGVIRHREYGEVFAYEVDGYGSHIMMDDANIPSLLALPLLGFVSISDMTYQNTRKMILGKIGNPYYLQGKGFKGIGGQARTIYCCHVFFNR